MFHLEIVNQSTIIYPNNTPVRTFYVIDISPYGAYICVKVAVTTTKYENH